MVKAIKAMLIPNNVQKTKMFQYAGASRFAYNWALAREIENATSLYFVMLIPTDSAAIPVAETIADTILTNLGLKSSALLTGVFELLKFMYRIIFTQSINFQ